MTRLIPLLSLGFAVASLTQMASAQSGPMEPGLYDLTALVTVSGSTFAEETTEVCVRKGENDNMTEELLSGGNKRAGCTSSKVVWTASTLTADFVCPATATTPGNSGSIDAEFAPGFLKHTITGELAPGLELIAKSNMRRKGDCPADWDDSDPFK